MMTRHRFPAAVMFVSVAFVLAVPALAQTSRRASPGLPLPAAMIRLAIPDVRAFDSALGGGFKNALYGTLPEDDGVARGFGQSQVGAKLLDQWGRFSGDTAMSFATVKGLQATSLALAVLSIGQLEMVLVLKAPLATLPDIFEAGTSRLDHGRTYHVVRTGAGDEGASSDTRMGLAWALDEGLLVIATSERAMKLALAAMAAGERFAPRLAGLASLELDTDVLQKDLYFKRDFFFGSFGSPTGAAFARGRIHAALRLEGGRFVEVREGASAQSETKGAVFEAPDAIASGWTQDASSLLTELRRGVLEPIPVPGLRPHIGVAPLPSSNAASADDRYATNIQIPAPRNGALTEAAELDAWTALLSSQKVPGFGYLVTKSKARLLAIPWPKEKDAEFASLLSATLTRRGARLAMPPLVTEDHVYLSGPGLPVLAYKRSGDFIWIAPGLTEVRAAPAIAWSPEISRFAKLNLTAARDEGRRWARIEGPRSSDTVRPWSDRVLGLLGWMPSVRTLEVERKVTGTAFSERVVFGLALPVAPQPVK